MTIDLNVLREGWSSVTVTRRVPGGSTEERRLVTRVQFDRFVVQGGDVFDADGHALTHGAGIKARREL